MASSRLWCTLVALLLAYCAAAADAAYYKRDLFNLIGNGTIQLQLTSGGYLNAVGGEVGYVDSSTDQTTTWRVELYLSEAVDHSVYLYNYAASRYLTYIEGFGFTKEGVKVQTVAEPVHGRWYFYEIDNTGEYKIATATWFADYYLSFSGSNKQDGATSFKILPVLPPPASLVTSY